jgi:hypothetical protein
VLLLLLLVLPLPPPPPPPPPLLLPLLWSDETYWNIFVSVPRTSQYQALTTRQRRFTNNNQL